MERRDNKLEDNEVIASRTYEVADSSPPDYVTIRLGRPKLRNEDGRYECGAEICEYGRVWVRYLNGADEFEALQLALILIGTDLKHINDQLSGRLRWLKEKREDLAFPTYPNFSLCCALELPSK